MESCPSELIHLIILMLIKLSANNVHEAHIVSQLALVSKRMAKLTEPYRFRTIASDGGHAQKLDLYHSCLRHNPMLLMYTEHLILHGPHADDIREVTSWKPPALMDNILSHTSTETCKHFTMRKIPTNPILLKSWQDAGIFKSVHTELPPGCWSDLCGLLAFFSALKCLLPHPDDKPYGATASSPGLLHATLHSSALTRTHIPATLQKLEIRIPNPHRIRWTTSDLQLDTLARSLHPTALEDAILLNFAYDTILAVVHQSSNTLQRLIMTSDHPWLPWQEMTVSGTSPTMTRLRHIEIHYRDVHLPLSHIQAQLRTILPFCAKRDEMHVRIHVEVLAYKYEHLQCANPVTWAAVDVLLRLSASCSGDLCEGVDSCVGW